MKKLQEILEKKKREQIEKHMPAKNAPKPDPGGDLEAFVEAFEQAWLDDRDTSRDIENDGFHPSSLGIKHGRCARRNAYMLRGVAKQNRFDSRILRVFANGHAVHDRLQKVLEKMDIQMQTEVKIDYNDPPIKGHCDGIIEWRGKKYVIEIKSCSEEVFINRLKWKKPKDEHFDQANIYAHVLDIDNIYIIYENKNCVPDKARALTRTGWKYHFELLPTDEILTYNIDRHEMEWESYSNKKLVFHMDNEPIMRVGNKHQSFLATKNHRWVVKNHKGERSERYTEDLNSNSWIPFHAPYAFDEPSLLTPREAELLGWLVTDGWISNNQYYICQSKIKGVVDILSLLKPDEFTHKEYDQITPIGETVHMHYFNLKGPLRDRFREILPKKSVLPSVISRLNKPALEGLYRGMIGGDGSWTTSGRGEQLGQLDGPVKTGFQILCTLLGIHLNLNEGKVNCYPGVREWMRTYKPTEELYTGDVWCPQTKNGYWVMEQDGKVVITGNTQELKVFECRADRKKSQKIINEWLATWRAHNAGELPKRPYKPGSSICAGCDLFTHCMNDSEIGVDIKKYLKEEKDEA